MVPILNAYPESMIPHTLRTLFMLSGSVSRSRFLVTGLVLAALKYSVDAGSYWYMTGKVWKLSTYLDPIFAERISGVDRIPTAYLAFLVVWALPFLWIGVAMSARRAREAGYSQWVSLGFLLPYVSYLTILVLIFSPARPPQPALDSNDELSFRSALGGLGLTVVLGTALIAALTEGLHYYGSALFMGVPFLLGTVTGYLFNAPNERSLGSTLGVVTLALILGSGGMLAFALEGLVCLVMAFPIMWLAAAPGGIFGRLLARRSVRPDRTLALVILAFPCSARLEQHFSHAGQREVVTSIAIDAPPQEVWQNVIAFSELPPPTDWLLKTGIAYPLRARIEGEGVGAVRYCEFTTGPFVEPITCWDPPHRLSFDVREQPDPMHEWSFYAQVRAPHLEDSFRSVRGEFRLKSTPDGGTLLEGSTWYTVEMGPAHYWKLWGDGIVHRIHERVLKHIRTLSTASNSLSPQD